MWRIPGFKLGVVAFVGTYHPLYLQHIDSWTAVVQAIERLGLPILPIWNISLMVYDVHKNYHHPDSGGECVTVDCDCSHACRSAPKCVLEP